MSSSPLRESLSSRRFRKRTRFKGVLLPCQSECFIFFFVFLPVVATSKSALNQSSSSRFLVVPSCFFLLLSHVHFAVFDTNQPTKLVNNSETNKYCVSCHWQLFNALSLVFSLLLLLLFVFTFDTPCLLLQKIPQNIIMIPWLLTACIYPCVIGKCR